MEQLSLLCLQEAPPPAWLRTDSILDQFSDSDRRKAYRAKVQQYSKEKASILEDVKHGFIIGSQEFVADIKARFIGDSKDAELPQHNSLFREFDPGLILGKASKALDFDLKEARNKPKISPNEKDSRDLLIYLLWQAGRLSNSAIGEYFGLTYSAVSRRVKIINDRISSDSGLRSDYEILKSQINGLLPKPRSI